MIWVHQGGKFTGTLSSRIQNQASLPVAQWFLCSVLDRLPRRNFWVGQVLCGLLRLFMIFSSSRLIGHVGLHTPFYFCRRVSLL
ncbi:MAG: hypothetical protein ABR99_10430 [Rhodobacter sp. BACL10 MAG-121220-bin24]|nr:MAG: hypothetical protein ABR99_10430 [Rhodobacter sp. BACL10 MAG-121220-bin24]